MNETTAPQTTTTPAPTPTRSIMRVSLMERLDTAKAAWALLAPETLFSNLTWGEFDAATVAARATRDSLRDIMLTKKAEVSTKLHADAAIRPLIKRVTAAVQADPAFGPNSALYRAMGFIPESERKSPAKPGQAVGAKHSVSRIDRIGMIIAGWAELAPESVFGGMSRAQFVAAAAPAIAARSALVVTNAASKGAIGARNLADAPIRGLLKRLVAGIKADPNYGPDSALYRALGFITDSERKSPTRTAKTANIVPAV